MSATPLISICLPTLNARDFLEERLATILAQTEQDWELIVCDSYSDDGTWEYLSQFSADPRLRLYQVPREGLYAGWNECLRRVRGELVYIATADDTMTDHCLRRLSETLLQHWEADIVMSETQNINVEGRVVSTCSPLIWRMLRQHLEKSPQGVFISREAFFLLLAGYPQGVGSVTGLMFRSRLLERSGLFPRDLSHLGDAEWALRVAAATGVIAISDRLATWRIRPGQATFRLDLRHTLIFREALDRVISDPGSGLPPEWKEVPGHREKLLFARTAEATVVSGLFLYELRRDWRGFPRRLWKAWRLDKRLFWERLRAGFTFSRWLQRKPDQIAASLLEDFRAPWPPTPLKPPGAAPCETDAPVRTGQEAA